MTEIASERSRARYIAAVCSLAVAAASVLAAGHLGQVGLGDGVLLLVVVVLTWTPVRFRRSGETHGLTVEDAVCVAYLLSARPGLAPVVLMTGTLIARALMGSPIQKTVFSVAPVGLASSAAVVTAGALGTGPGVLDLRSVVVTGVSLAVYAAVSFVVMAGLFRTLHGTSIREMSRGVLVSNAATWAISLTVGLLLTSVARSDPRAIWLVAALAVAVQMGYRAYGRQVEDRRRTETLAGLSMSLGQVASGTLGVTRWLDDVAGFFGADGVMLVERDGTRSFADGSDERAAPPLRRETGVPARLPDGLVARAPAGETGIAIAVYGRRGLEPWNEADQHLLEVIAGEAAVALENAELFRQVERERARWQEESAKLNDILTAASDGIATITADGRIASWNPGMATTTGVSAGQAVGGAWWAVLRVRDAGGDDLIPEGQHVITSALSGERHDDPVTVQVLRRDGQWRWVRATFSPLLSQDGDVDGTVIVARDVTAEREVEELKADFVATVSHELRTPLTPLKGFLATVRHRSDMLTPDQLALLHESMESQVERLERLVNDLLVVADLDHGRIRVQREAVALFEAVEVASAEEQAPDVDRVRVVGDRDLAAAGDSTAVVRILRALISNALKHSDGPVTVGIDREGSQVSVRVQDEGPGIPPWEHDRIFKRFHRLGDHLHRTQGPGLGLAIAKALADHIGGTIEVDSDVGGGATFTLRLPTAGPVASDRTWRSTAAG